MTQEIQCGVCATRYQVKAELAGTLVDCPRCHAKMLVPRKPKASSGDSAAGTPRIISEMLPVVGEPPPAARSTPPGARSTPPAARPPVSPATASSQTKGRASPAAPAAAKDDADDVIRFRDDDDDQPAARPKQQIEPEDEVFDIAPEPIAPPLPRGERGSIAGQSRAGQSRAGQSRAGQSRSGESSAGETRAGQSRAGQSRAGQSRAGRSGSTVGFNPREKRIDPLPPDLDDSANTDDFGQLLDINEPARAEDDVEPFNFTIPALPPLITRTIMPWALIIICLGGAGYNAVSNVLALPGRPVGLSMVGLALLLYALVVVGFTLKAIYSAAITAQLRLPDAVWFQTFALVAMPTAGLVIGYYAGGIGPMITLGLLGLLLMVVPMAFMFRADVMQALLTAFYAASAYVASAALSAAILIGLGFALNRSTLVLPWKPEPAAVAVAKAVEVAPQVVIVPDASPTTTTAAQTAPPTSTAKPVAAPAIAAAPAPVPTGPAWRMPVEPVASAAAWPIPQAEVHESIEVTTPIATAHASSAGPFVAILQPKTTAIYDLRTGKRTGFLKAAFQPRNLILSPDGTLLAGVETALSQNSTVFAADGVANTTEIWSTADNRLVGQLPSGQSAVVPLGFAAADASAAPGAETGEKLITYGSSNGMSGVQVWDSTTESLVHQWSTPPIAPKPIASSLAISNSGKYVAVVTNPVIRVLDVQSGDIAGEMSSPVDLTQSKGVAISADGKTLAAIVPSNPSAAPISAPAGAGANATLLEWSIADGGKLLRTLPIDLTAAALPIDPEAGANGAADATDVAYLQWTPDSRLLRIGNGLYEATSGKAIYAFPAQSLGNLSGRLASVADKRAVFEFPPAGTGTHFVIKTVDLPNAMIDSAVEMLTRIGAPAATGNGSTTSPTAAPDAALPGGAAPNGTGAVNAMILSPAALPAAAPPSGPAPEATVELALQGEWDVTIKSMIAADPVLIQKQLAALSQSITKTQNALADALLRSEQVSHYHEMTQADGEIVRQYDYSEDVRTSAEALVSTLQDRIRDDKAKVVKLQHAAETAPLTRILLGALDNGIGVTITTDTDSAAALADKMHTGDRVHVVGFGQIHDGVLQVKLRGARPATAPAH